MPKITLLEAAIVPTRKVGKRPNAAKPKRRASGNHGVLFHGPSFTTGAIVGAAIVILTAYGPELLQSPRYRPPTTSPAHPRRSLIFEFDTLLKDTEVQADPETRGSRGSYPRRSKVHDSGSVFPLIRRCRETARSTDAGKSGGPHRADQRQQRNLVSRAGGPFTWKVDADRAMTKLRQRNLSAIPVNDHD